MKKVLFWILSFIITIFFALFQRLTGPTYPLSGTLTLDGEIPVSFRLTRSCTIAGQDCLIKVKTPVKTEGYVSWRRYKTDDAWTETEMNYRDGVLSALLPDQPPAGKLEYRVFVKQKKGDMEIYSVPIITRFKGAVPAAILVPHVFFMFLFMLFSVRIFITVFTKDTVIKHAVMFNILFLLLGGFILGPVTQFYAFGAYWTGWPFGYDMTDNKTLVMLVFWIAALYAVFRAKKFKPWLLAAFVVTTLVYLVPHSMFGSELDYKKGEVVTGGK